MSQIQTTFSYADLEPAVRDLAQAAARNIRGHARLAGESIIAIGGELSRVKAALPHGQWLPWLEAEFGWSEWTARRFMNVHEAFGKAGTVPDLDRIGLKALYMLAAPSTPEHIRQEAIRRAAAGDQVTYATVVRMRDDDEKQYITLVRAESASDEDQPQMAWVTYEPSNDDPKAVSAKHSSSAAATIKSHRYFSLREYLTSAAPMHPQEAANVVPTEDRAKIIGLVGERQQWLNAFVRALEHVLH